MMSEDKSENLVEQAVALPSKNGESSYYHCHIKVT